MKRAAPPGDDRRTTNIVRDEPKDAPRPEKRAKTQPSSAVAIWDELIKPQPTIKDTHLKQLKDLLLEAVLAIKGLENDNAMIEVELRLGRAKSNFFQAGVHESSYSRIQDYLGSKEEWDMFGERSTEFHYNTATGEGSWRVSVDGFLDPNHRGGPLRQTCQGCHLKMKDKDINFVFNNQEHDARVGISKEIIQDDIPPTVDLDSFKVRRDKDRSSFENTTTGVRVDITKVITHQPQSQYVVGNSHQSRGVTSYEVEIEVTQSRWEEIRDNIDSGKATAEAETEALAIYLYDLLMELLQLIKIDPNTTVPLPTQFGDVKMVHETASDKILALKQHVVKAFSSLDSTVSGDFPGSMPVTFSRRHYQLVKSGDYMFSEKTDGLRYLLLMCETGFYLIDRKYAFFKLLNCQELVQQFVFKAGEPVISLLDGELVRNRDTNKVFFLIFDIVQSFGESVASLILQERLKRVSQIVQVFRDLEESKHKQNQTFETPFILIAKVQTETKNGEIHRYFNDKSKRNHKTDGIIMTPNEPYRMKTVDNLYKWKYPDLQSIDFRAKHLGGGLFSLSMSIGQDGETECFQTKFPPNDLAKLQQDMRTYQKHLDAIVELVYDTARGCWRYHTIRPDKKTPNFVRIVFDTLAIIAENVTPKELIEQFTKKPHPEGQKQIAPQHKPPANQNGSNQ